MSAAVVVLVAVVALLVLVVLCACVCAARDERLAEAWAEERRAAERAMREGNRRDYPTREDRVEHRRRA